MKFWQMERWTHTCVSLSNFETPKDTPKELRRFGAFFFAERSLSLDLVLGRDGGVLRRRDPRTRPDLRGRIRVGFGGEGSFPSMRLGVRNGTGCWMGGSYFVGIHFWMRLGGF